jgi:acetate kinase
MTKESKVSQLIHKVLTINGGSSSIKFALYQVGEPMQRILAGKIERIGLPATTLSFAEKSQSQQISRNISVSDYSAAVDFLLHWFEQRIDFSTVSAVGHRVVHGMSYTESQFISQPVLDELHRISSYDPQHLPAEIKLIEKFHQHYPQLTQVACFDTAFHQSLPRVAKLLPIPRRFDELGIQRYGFHGLSYAYLMQQLERTAGTQVAQGRVILAHLGNGASLAAVRNGQSIDTSMGFTPAGGVPMGTRSGDLDPGVAWYMMQSEHLSAEQFNHLINHECGLLGMSETSSDMLDLIEQQETDARAAEAVELFCYQIKKCIGAYSAALGGLDTLVFSGGIGEHAALIRARICSELELFGINIDQKSNAANAAVISTQTSQVTVRVMHTDEELMIATSVIQMLARPNEKETEDEYNNN